jgi:nucleoid DNA-binding protein
MVGRPGHAADTAQAFPPGQVAILLGGNARRRPDALEETGAVTKKEIVKQIADRIGETQLKTKDVVQQTFDAIVDTLIEQGRIELRNFGVFEVKQRKARKARNPRTGAKVEVPPKCVVTFKPGKEMEERVRRMSHVPVQAGSDSAANNGTEGDGEARTGRGARGTRKRKPARHSVAGAE